MQSGGILTYRTHSIFDTQSRRMIHMNTKLGCRCEWACVRRLGFWFAYCAINFVLIITLLFKQ